MVVETGWIEVPASLSEDEVRQDRGVSVTRVVSKYDAPKAVRAIQDPSAKSLMVEFRYFGGPEAMRHVKFSPRIFGMIGKQSHRIYLLSFDGVSSEAELHEVLEQALAELKTATESKRKEVSAGNTVATENVLDRVVKPWLPRARPGSLVAG